MKLDSSAFVADQELIRALCDRASAVDCCCNQVLFAQGDAPAGVYIVQSGEVTMTMESPTGDEVIATHSEPGSLLGLPGVVGNAPYSMSAYARAGAEISFLSRDDFSELMLREPRLAMMILRVLASEVRTARIALSGQSRESLKR